MTVCEGAFALEEAAVWALMEPQDAAITTKKHQRPTRIFMTSFKGNDAFYKNTGLMVPVMCSAQYRIREVELDALD